MVTITAQQLYALSPIERQRVEAQIRIQEQQAAAVEQQEAALEAERMRLGEVQEMQRRAAEEAGALETAKYLWRRGKGLPPDSPKLVKKYYQQLWTSGYMQVPSPAGVYQLPTGELMSLDPRRAPLPSGAVKVGPPGFIPEAERVEVSEAPIFPALPPLLPETYAERAGVPVIPPAAEEFLRKLRPPVEAEVVPYEPTAVLTPYEAAKAAIFEKAKEIKAKPFFEKIREAVLPLREKYPALFRLGGIPPREGEIVFGVGGKIVGRNLPYGMSRYSKSVDWFRVQEGKLVPIPPEDRPKTIVGAAAEAVWGIAGLVPEELEFGPQVEISPGLWDLPGQVIFDVIFSPLFGQMKAAKVKGKTTLKAVKKADKRTIDKVRDILDKAIHSGKGKTDVEKDLAKLMKAYKDGATAAGVDKKIIDMNLKSMLDYSLSEGYFVYRPELPITKEVIKPTIEEVFAGLPITEISPETLPSIYAGLGLYERAWTPEEQFLKAREAWLRERPVEDYGIGIETPEFRAFAKPSNIFESTAPEGNVFVGLEPGIRGRFGDLGVSAVSPRVLEGLSPRARARIEAEERMREIERLRGAQWDGLASADVLQSRLRDAQESATRERLKSGQAAWTGLASASALGQATSTVQTTRLKYRLKEPLKPRFPRPRIPRPKLKLRPRIPPPLMWWPRDRARRVRRRRPVRRPGEFFIPEIRRRGKWFPISRPTGLFKAVTAGKRRVARTLAASLRVRGPRGLVLLTPFGPKWRRAKRDPFVIIERRKFRLDVPSEISEIQKARRKKKRKKKGGGNEFFK